MGVFFCMALGAPRQRNLLSHLAAAPAPAAPAPAAADYTVQIGPNKFKAALQELFLS